MIIERVNITLAINSWDNYSALLRNSEELKIVTPSCSGRIASASMTRATSLASMDFQLPGNKRNRGAKSVSFIRCFATIAQ
ncbi:Uncharacterised protein [Escherichia coli]|nr:Uncharacterised protein [Escherichia coli]